jgi:hypothetical protein
MSESPLPKSLNEAAPQLLWGVFAFASGFEGIAMLFEGHFLLATIGIIGAIVLTSIAVRWDKIANGWPRFTATFNNAASNANWWIGVIAICLAGVILSPFVEQHRWPFAKWLPTTTIHEPATAEEIAKATAPIKSQLDVAKKELESTKQELQATVTELENTKQELENTKQQLEAERKSRQASIPAAKPALPKKKYLTYDLTNRQKALDEFENCIEAQNKVYLRGLDIQLNGKLGLREIAAAMADLQKSIITQRDGMERLNDKYRDKYPEIEQLASLKNNELSARTDSLQKEATRIIELHGGDDRPILLMNNQVFADWRSALNDFRNLIVEKQKAIVAKRKEYESAEVYDNAKQ